MKQVFIISILFFPLTFFGQIQKTQEVEVLGKPTWDMPILLEDNGLLFLVKSDITKIKMFRFSKELELLWDKEYFLDAEAAPKAYTIADDHVSLMFSETQGMYYQVFDVDLQNGDLNQTGFELRDYFVDNDYVFLKNKVIMAGSNEKGAAFYQYDFQEEIGELITKDITGKVRVNLFEYLPEQGIIESIWAVKEQGYTNEKKKKGEYIKDAYLVHAIFDTTGALIEKSEIRQSEGKFPTEGKLARLPNGRKLIVGLYQSSVGDKGVFSYDLTSKGRLNTFPFSQMLKGTTSLTVEDLQKLYSSYNFLPNDPVITEDGRVLFGGVFFSPQYRTISENDNTFNDPFMTRNSRYGYDRFGNRMVRNNRSRTREVFIGFNYPTGFVAEFGSNGEFLGQNRIDINHTSNQVQYALSYNKNGAVGFCVKGDVGISNFNISAKPLLYKLSEESAQAKLQAFVPSYNSVRFWYDNSFIAIGSRSKIEAISVNDNIAEGINVDKKKKKRGKNKKPSTYAQVRKVYYLTKIASGF